MQQSIVIKHNTRLFLPRKDVNPLLLHWPGTFIPAGTEVELEKPTERFYDHCLKIVVPVKYGGRDYFLLVEDLEDEKKGTCSHD